MVKQNHNIGGYTTEQAANIVGVTPSRIRQLATGDDAIDHEKVLGRLIITETGIKQAKSRNKKIGRIRKTLNGNGSKK